MSAKRDNHITVRMYQQRRGLAQPTLQSDQEARNANFVLMHSKRRQVLEAQLAEKMELLKQFTNTRGIGMRGQSVPQHDIELLQQQIAALRQQLDGGAETGASLPVTPSSQAAAVTPGSVRSEATPFSSGQPGRLEPAKLSNNNSYPFPTAPSSTASTGSRRDMVWQQKYESWLQRNGRAPQLSGALQNFVPSSSASVASSAAPSQFSAVAPSQRSAPPQSYPLPAYPQQAAGPQFPQPLQQQQQQQPWGGAAVPSQPQQQIMYGRRATPPNSAGRTDVGVFPGSAAPQPQQQHGRRAQQVSQRPW